MKSSEEVRRKEWKRIQSVVKGTSRNVTEIRFTSQRVCVCVSMHVCCAHGVYGQQCVYCVVHISDIYFL